MKLQFSESSIRVRITESDLATLLDGGSLVLEPQLAGERLFRFVIAVSDVTAISADGDWHVQVGRAALGAYVATLPRRDALRIVAAPLAGDPAGIAVDLEVDVRDSIATRGARRGSVE